MSRMNFQTLGDKIEQQYRRHVSTNIEKNYMMYKTGNTQAFGLNFAENNNINNFWNTTNNIDGRKMFKDGFKYIGLNDLLDDDNMIFKPGSNEFRYLYKDDIKKRFSKVI